MKTFSLSLEKQTGDVLILLIVPILQYKRLKMKKGVRGIFLLYVTHTSIQIRTLSFSEEKRATLPITLFF
jgi:hypothetical protein